MNEYLKVSKKLAKKQLIESIKLEIIYELFILNNKEMDITRIDSIYLYTKKEYIKLIDESINSINAKLTNKIKRENDKIILG